MAVFNPGVNGTIKSTTLEAALMEGALLLQNEEAAQSTAQAEIDNMGIDFFTGDDTTRIVFNCPLQVSQDDQGRTVFTAADYLAFNFANGGGDIKSATLPDAILELFQKISTLEQAQNLDNVQVNYNAETLVATCTAEYNVAFTVNADGTVKITAQPYLA